MRHLLFGLPLLLLTACQLAPSGPAAVPAVPGELLVRFQPGLSDAQKGALRTAYGATAIKAIMPDGERWTLEAGRDVATAIAALASDTEFKAVQPNHLRHLALPDRADPALAPQLGAGLAAVSAAPIARLRSVLQAASDPDYGKQWHLPRDGFDKVWSLTTGQGVKVAVIDSGVDPNHPDLKANLLPMIDEVVAMGNHDSLNNDSYDGRDGHGHGTHVCGIVGAVQNNGIGISGAAPGVKILPVKVTTATGDADDATISRGITDAVNQGAQIINLSIGGPDPSPVLLEALNYAFNRNVAVVIAAGNDGRAVNYPAAYDGVLSVGAITPANKVASYSSHGAQLVLVAPGGSVPGDINGQPVYSTTPTYPCYITLFERKTNSYAGLSGTSMAAPQVTAAAALLLSREKGLTPAQVRTRLAATTDDGGDTGFDEFFGFGVLNVDKALHQGQDDGRRL